MRALPPTIVEKCERASLAVLDRESFDLTANKCSAALLH
jgi:hypothetical protein